MRTPALVYKHVHSKMATALRKVGRCGTNVNWRRAAFLPRKSYSTSIALLLKQDCHWRHCCACHQSARTGPHTRGLATQAEAPPQPVGALASFWKWLNTAEEKEQKVITEEEIEERDALLQRVQAMYFANPPVAPDLAFYKEVFEALVKFNDRVAVEILWRFMKEMKVEPDEDLVQLVEPFLVEAQRNAWFE